MIIREIKLFRIRDFGLVAMCAVSWTRLEQEAMDRIRKMLQRQRVCMTDKSRQNESTFYRISLACLLILNPSSLIPRLTRWFHRGVSFDRTLGP
jgi:hypothetical protein